MERRRQQVLLLARDQAHPFALDPDPLPNERRQLVVLPATSVVDIVSSQDVVV